MATQNSTNNYDNSKVKQVVTATTNTEITSATIIPKDDTIPQNTEGVEILTATITPTSTSNKLVMQFFCPVCETSGWDWISAALFKDSDANAIQASMAIGGNAVPRSPSISLTHVMTAPSTSAQTYKVRMGGSSATIYINRVASGSVFSTIPSCTFTIMEVEP